jgi:hypothetical protein
MIAASRPAYFGGVCGVGEALGSVASSVDPDYFFDGCFLAPPILLALPGPLRLSCEGHGLDLISFMPSVSLRWKMNKSEKGKRLVV